jgi:hypothetical protein
MSGHCRAVSVSCIYSFRGQNMPRYRNTIFIAFLYVWFCIGALAEDHGTVASTDLGYTVCEAHLVPATPSIDRDARYDCELRDVLLTSIQLPKGYSFSYGCYTKPSFGPESFVGVCRTGGRQSTGQEWKIVHAQANTNIWIANRLQADGDWKPRKGIDRSARVKGEPEGQVRISVRSLPSPLGYDMAQCWSAVLAQTKYPQRYESGLDGVTYVFFGWDAERGWMYGNTWSPERGAPAALVDTVGALILYCGNPHEDSGRVEEVVKRLQRTIKLEASERVETGSPTMKTGSSRRVKELIRE